MSLRNACTQSWIDRKNNAENHLSPIMIKTNPFLKRLWTAGLLIALLAGFFPQGRALAAPTGNWTNVRSMNTARLAHTATLLANGKVLVAGGDTAFGVPANLVIPTTSAEIYDPIANTWPPAAMLTTGRVYHTAALLANGRVLWWLGGL
jgi:hypothetical protein